MIHCTLNQALWYNVVIVTIILNCYGNVKQIQRHISCILCIASICSLRYVNLSFLQELLSIVGPMIPHSILTISVSAAKRLAKKCSRNTTSSGIIPTSLIRHTHWHYTYVTDTPHPVMLFLPRHQYAISSGVVPTSSIRICMIYTPQ